MICNSETGRRNHGEWNDKVWGLYRGQINCLEGFGGEAFEETEGPVFYHSLNLPSEIR